MFAAESSNASTEPSDWPSLDASGEALVGDVVEQSVVAIAVTATLKKMRIRR
jgi:hypothetical protein